MRDSIANVHEHGVSSSPGGTQFGNTDPDATCKLEAAAPSFVASWQELSTPRIVSL
jgi:hypothetical protein